ILVAVHEEMRHERAVSGRTDHEMNMGWSKRMASHRGQQLAGWTVVRDGIAYGLEGAKSIGACRVRTEAGAKMTAGLVIILNVIHSIGRGLPDLDERIGNWLPARVGDMAAHLERFTFFFAQQNAFPGCELALLSCIEWPKHRRCAKPWSAGLID